MHFHPNWENLDLTNLTSYIRDLLPLPFVIYTNRPFDSRAAEKLGGSDMGLMDKANEMKEQAAGLADKAKEMAEKVPGGEGISEKIDEVTDKIPGAGDGEAEAEE